MIREGLVTPTDRGSQYASERYLNLFEENGIKASISRKGNCYDNAFAESFFHTMKIELIHREIFKTREEAQNAISENIEVW